MNEEKKETNGEEKEKKRRILIIILIIGIVACICVTVWALFFRDGGTPLVPDYAPKQTQDGLEKVTGDGSKLDVPSGGGGISIEYESNVTVSLSDGKAYFSYTHPEKSTQNIVLRIEVQGEVIAQSDLIEPGNKLTQLDLESSAAKILQPGTYENAKFRIFSYDPTTGEKAMVDTEAEITVTVKE